MLTRTPWHRLGERGRLAVSLLALAALYALVIALGDTRAWSGSDAGGKVATVKVMAETGSWVPDVGYWAAEEDPDGRHHPLWGTQQAGDRWLQVTTLPMVYLGVPLWRLGGPTALLVLPALGSLLAAYGARRLARAVAQTDGWATFWLVGGASPVLFYAGDFWEHAPAVGLALLAIALALEGDGVPRAAAAGLLGGVAVVLRTEVALYLVALAVVALVVAAERRHWLDRPSRIGAVVVPAGAVLGLNALIERALVGQGIRDQRAGDQVVAVGADAASRLRDALVTSVGLWPSVDAAELAAGTVAVTAVALVGLWAVRGSPAPMPRWAVVAGVLAVALYATRLASGLGFAPGFLTASVLAPVGIAALAGRPGRARLLGVVALGALPPIWLLQWRGQLVPQWGGRYVLLSGTLLVVVAAVALERAGWRRTGSVLVVGLAVAVSAFGAVWHAERTSGVARAAEAIAAAPSDVVLISTIAHLGREAGTWYGDRPWLRADSTAELEPAAALARRAGAARIDVIEDPGRRGQAEVVSAAGWREVSERTVTYVLGISLTVRRFEWDGGSAAS